MATVLRWTGGEARLLRESMRMGVREFAAHLGYNDAAVSNWERRGDQARLRTQTQRDLDTALKMASDEARERFDLARRLASQPSVRLDAPPDTDELLVALAEAVDAAGIRTGRSRRSADIVDLEDHVQRRALLQGLTALAAGAIATASALEAIRNGLTASVTGNAPTVDDVDEWEQIVWEHGCSYRTERPEAFVVALAADLAYVRQQLDIATDDRRRRDLSRIGGQLAALMAMSLVNLGRFTAARRWWYTARRAADVGRDPAIRAWVRGQEVVHVPYAGRPLQAAVNLADEVQAIGAKSCAGTIEALAGKAQALALLGRGSEAVEVVAAVADLFERLPDAVSAERGAIFGWPEHRLRHTQSFVYSHLGSTAEANRAQTRAFEIYPATARRAHALVQLHKAMCYVHDGDIDDGAELAASSVEAVPSEHRSSLLVGVGRTVLHAVPAREQGRPAVAALRRVLALPAGSAT